MEDNLINEKEIYLQDVICSLVNEHPKLDDFSLYNTIVTMVDVPSIETTQRILELITINKTVINN